MVHDSEGLDIVRLSGREWSCVKCDMSFGDALDAHEHWGNMNREGE